MSENKYRTQLLDDMRRSLQNDIKVAREWEIRAVERHLVAATQLKKCTEHVDDLEGMLKALKELEKEK